MSNVDISGELWASQGYANAAISTIRALQSKKIGVFYNRTEIPFHINFCQPHYYQLNNDYKVEKPTIYMSSASANRRGETTISSDWTAKKV